MQAIELRHSDGSSALYRMGLGETIFTTVAGRVEELENWDRWVTDEKTSIKALDLRHFAHRSLRPRTPRAIRGERKRATLLSGDYC